MKLAFFGYAWNTFFRPDAYMNETIDSLVRAGVHVDLYLGNQAAGPLGIYDLNPKVPIDRLARLMDAEGYDGAISFNNSMLMPQITSAIHGRIATVIVDEPEHLFDYPRAGLFEAFKQDVEIVAMSSVLEERLLAAVPGVESRLHFRLPATRVAPQEERGSRMQHPISWVATYLGDRNIDDYLILTGNKPEYYALTERCLDVLERHGNLATVKAIGGRDMALIGALPWTFEFFQAQLQNILTNRRRLEVVQRLSPLGLSLFGNPRWLRLVEHDKAVFKAFQPGPAPTTHADLQAVYNASRISINTPQTHVTPRAVQYRVIDVMASNALMITQRNPQSDLYRVFGEDCPVPTYTTLDEMEELCRYYLDHEKERREIVEQCNALLATGFDFDERARDLLGLIGLEAPQTATPGERRWIDLRILHEQ